DCSAATAPASSSALRASSSARSLAVRTALLSCQRQSPEAPGFFGRRGRLLFPRATCETTGSALGGLLCRSTGTFVLELDLDLRERGLVHLYGVFLAQLALQAR